MSASADATPEATPAERLREFWNRRYAATAYAYGTEPNDFLVAQEHSFPRGSRVLCLADGEGRNGVWLAARGHELSTVDISDQGLEKARELARVAGVHIDAQLADVTRFEPGVACWDAIVSIFLHLPASPRQALHRRCAVALRPGGRFVYEAYARGQRGRGTGGPDDPALLPELEELLDDWPGCRIEHRFSGARVIREGALHHGEGVVNQVVARRPE